LAAEFWLLNRSKSAGGGSLCTWSKLLKLAIFGKMITNPGNPPKLILNQQSTLAGVERYRNLPCRSFAAFHDDNLTAEETCRGW
jgi:hypothetical protein